MSNVRKECLGRKKYKEFRKWHRQARKEMRGVADNWSAGNSMLVLEYIEADLQMAREYYTRGFSPVVYAEIRPQLDALNLLWEEWLELKSWLDETHYLHGEVYPKEHFDVKDGIVSWMGSDGKMHSLDTKEYHQETMKAMSAFMKHYGEFLINLSGD